MNAQQFVLSRGLTFLLVSLSLPSLVAQSPPVQDPVSSRSPGLVGPTIQSPPPPIPPFEMLSMAERKQLKAAHDEALKSDPTIHKQWEEATQKMDEFHKALHAAMIKVDPTVEPLIQKMQRHRNGSAKLSDQKSPTPSTRSPDTFPQRGDNADNVQLQKTKGPLPGSGLANLSENERARFMQTREKVKNIPSVVAARKALHNTTNPEERREASAAYHVAVNDAMLNIDPSIAPILQKMQPIEAQKAPSLTSSGSDQQPSGKSINSK